MYKHFILTRFNLKLDGISDLDKNNKPVQTEEWIENRFFLFEKYCFPSIMNQKCKNFIWFVLFDTNTPYRYIQKIKNYELQFPLFKPLFMEAGDYDSIKNTFNKVMKVYLEAGDQYIITSRIDNDDVFHQEMIGEVQKQFKKQANIFLSFTYGLQYDISQKVLARMHYKKNHFISRIEKITNGIDTVITHDHSSIDKVARVIYINNKSKPMWLELIHESNIKNELDTTSVPLFFNKKTGSFQLKVEISPQNTIIAVFKYLKLRALLARAAFLRMLGIYDFLKRVFKKQ